MNLLKKIYYRRSRILASIVRRLSFLMPNDSFYLRVLFGAEMGKCLNLKKPKTFNEKLQWLKIHNRKPEYTTMVDKYAVKEYVAKCIGDEYVIPTLGVWNDPSQINWDKLPDKFVLKTTHGGGGGGVILCTNKSSFDVTASVLKLKKNLKRSVYKDYREWPYKNVPKRIIAEQMITSLDENGNQELKDYKFFCFNGKVKFFKVDFGRFIDHHANYYSPLGRLLPFGERSFPPVPEHVEVLPPNLSDMIELAEKLSKGLPFLRVDLYNISGKIYFGELTFYPAGGVGKFTSEEWDLKLGSYIDVI